MAKAPRLNLAARAMKRCPAGLARSNNLRAAAGARLARSGIDPVELLGRAGAAIDMDIISKRGAAMADRIVDDAMNRVAKSVEVFLGKGASGPFRRDLCLVANFAGVNVADAGDQGVIHEHGLDGLATRIGLGKLCWGNGRCGLDPKPEKSASLLQRRAGQQGDSAKSSRIVINNGLLRAVAGQKANPYMVMLALRMARSESNGSRHPQVDHENSSRGQWEKDISPQALGAFLGDAGARKALGIARRELIPQRVLARLRERDGGSGYARHLSANIFNFWKLWHKIQPIKKE